MFDDDMPPLERVTFLAPTAAGPDSALLQQAPWRAAKPAETVGIGRGGSSSGSSGSHSSEEASLGSASVASGEASGMPATSTMQNHALMQHLQQQHMQQQHSHPPPHRPHPVASSSSASSSFSRHSLFDIDFHALMAEVSVALNVPDDPSSIVRLDPSSIVPLVDRLVCAMMYSCQEDGRRERVLALLLTLRNASILTVLAMHPHFPKTMKHWLQQFVKKSKPTDETVAAVAGATPSSLLLQLMDWFRSMPSTVALIDSLALPALPATATAAPALYLRPALPQQSRAASVELHTYIADKLEKTVRESAMPPVQKAAMPAQIRAILERWQRFDTKQWWDRCEQEVPIAVAPLPAQAHLSPLHIPPAAAVPASPMLSPSGETDDPVAATSGRFPLRCIDVPSRQHRHHENDQVAVAKAAMAAASGAGQTMTSASSSSNNNGGASASAQGDHPATPLTLEDDDAPSSSSSSAAFALPLHPGSLKRKRLTLDEGRNTIRRFDASTNKFEDDPTFTMPPSILCTRGPAGLLVSPRTRMHMTLGRSVSEQLSSGMEAAVPPLLPFSLTSPHSDLSTTIREVFSSPAHSSALSALPESVVTQLVAGTIPPLASCIPTKLTRLVAPPPCIVSLETVQRAFVEGIVPTLAHQAPQWLGHWSLLLAQLTRIDEILLFEQQQQQQHRPACSFVDAFARIVEPLVGKAWSHPSVAQRPMHLAQLVRIGMGAEGYPVPALAQNSPAAHTSGGNGQGSGELAALSSPAIASPSAATPTGTSTAAGVSPSNRRVAVPLNQLVSPRTSPGKIGSTVQPSPFASPTLATNPATAATAAASSSTAALSSSQHAAGSHAPAPTAPSAPLLPAPVTALPVVVQSWMEGPFRCQLAVLREPPSSLRNGDSSPAALQSIVRCFRESGWSIPTNTGAGGPVAVDPMRVLSASQVVSALWSGASAPQRSAMAHAGLSRAGSGAPSTTLLCQAVLMAFGHVAATAAGGSTPLILARTKRNISTGVMQGAEECLFNLVRPTQQQLHSPDPPAAAGSYRRSGAAPGSSTSAPSASASASNSSMWPLDVSDDAPRSLSPQPVLDPSWDVSPRAPIATHQKQQATARRAQGPTVTTPTHAAPNNENGTAAGTTGHAGAAPAAAANAGANQQRPMPQRPTPQQAQYRLPPKRK